MIKRSLQFCSIISSESVNTVDYAATDIPPPGIGSITGHKLSLAFEARRKSRDLTTEGSPNSNSQYGSTFKKVQ